jgi:hypothetical protein
MVTIYHQLGHRYQWSLDSIRDDKSGEGVICAPRYMPPTTVQDLPASLRSVSLFDPQFFLPSSKKGSLADYNFFPAVIADGFSTSQYGPELAQESAHACTQFQCSNGFKYCVIPTRHREGSPSDFIDSQMMLFVEPFLRSYSQQGPDRPLLLQLVLNDTMLKDPQFSNSVLNWVTGIGELAGVYLIPQMHRTSKQIDDIDSMWSLLHFIHALRQNNLDVVVGYVNTEALLLLAADPTGVTLGSYENLRMFNLRAFEDEDQGPVHGPNARIYVSTLLQWIDYQYIGAITREIPAGDFFDDTQYRIQMFEPSYNWHFTKPEPYKHYFAVFSSQLRRFSSLPLPQRIARIGKACREANARFGELEQMGVVFDKDSDGHHLPRWITALNQFGKDVGLA